jgi:RNA recognition motif-containing protein
MTKKLDVADLAYNVTGEMLADLFSACGSVKSATVMINKITDLPDGYGFVEMSCESEAQEAIQKLNSTEVEGRTIKVNVARPRLVSARRKRLDSKMWDSEGLYPIWVRLDPSAKRFARITLHRPLRDILINESSSREEFDAWEQDAADWFATDQTDT